MAAPIRYYMKARTEALEFGANFEDLTLSGCAADNEDGKFLELFWRLKLDESFEAQVLVRIRDALERTVHEPLHERQLAVFQAVPPAGDAGVVFVASTKPSDPFGCLVGSSGAVLNEIRTKTRAAISLEPCDRPVRNVGGLASARLLSISSHSYDAVRAAARLVVARLAAEIARLNRAAAADAPPAAATPQFTFGGAADAPPAAATPQSTFGGAAVSPPAAATPRFNFGAAADAPPAAATPQITFGGVTFGAAVDSPPATAAPPFHFCYAAHRRFLAAAAGPQVSTAAAAGVPSTFGRARIILPPPASPQARAQAAPSLSPEQCARVDRNKREAQVRLAETLEKRRRLSQGEPSPRSRSPRRSESPSHSPDSEVRCRL